MTLKELGVPTQKCNQLAQKGIETVPQLLQYMPRRYVDLTAETGFLPQEQVSCVILQVRSVRADYAKKYVMVSGRTRQGGTRVSVFWFRQLWLTQKLQALEGQELFVAGHASFQPDYGSFTIGSPIYWAKAAEHKGFVMPVYPPIPGMSGEYLLKLLEKALQSGDGRTELLPRDVVEAKKLDPMEEVLDRIHHPKSMAQARQAEKRILFNDLMEIALRDEWNKTSVNRRSRFRPEDETLYKKLLAELPFTLTEDQAKTVDAMLTDARAGRRVNGMIHGDVGCGKTVVAFLLMAAFAGSGYQAALMAPTHVLANQHYEDAKKLLEPLGLRVVFLSAEGLTAKERRERLRCVESGEARIVIGTHALTGKDVTFDKLALVVVDEEHRFGVRQREALARKAAAGVHTVSMSATPIPRSLAMVLRADDTMRLYTIRSMPNGREPVQTGIASSREKIYRWVLGQAKKGKQTYVVCPMIDETDSELLAGVKSVEETAAEYAAALEPKGVRTAILTGRTGREETAEILEKFRAGEICVLISTTVVEVGMNVPTATTMVITSAERFGLASLHQLRGRVGRGSDRGICVLEPTTQEKKALDRLQILCATNDGFEIAQADLELRGPGDFVGTQQSGSNKTFELMAAHPEAYREARAIARDLWKRGKDCCPMTQAIAAALEETQAPA